MQRRIPEKAPLERDPVCGASKPVPPAFPLGEQGSQEF